MDFIKLVLVYCCSVIPGGIQQSRSGRYDRSWVKEKYPEFGNRTMFMTTAEGDVVTGYYEVPKNTRFAICPEVERSVKFTLFTRNNWKGTDVRNSTSLLAQGFDRSLPTKFITHGWLSSGTSDTCMSIMKAFLQEQDVNVIIVDWSAISDNIFYPVAQKATGNVGKFYGTFLNQLVDAGVDPATFHLVGHSLGAHVSGFAARAVRGGGVGRVTGLDPALPGFTNDPRLGPKDAHFVDIIHTCAGFLGINDPIGHADFYPNGGYPIQPGCDTLVELIESCSHGRSWKFFARSISTPGRYIARRCQSMETFEKNQCSGNEKIPMGIAAPAKSRGRFFLKTQADSIISKLTEEILNFL